MPLNRLLEKCAILLICIPAFGMTDGLILPVTALLLSAAVSAVIQLRSGTRLAALLIAGWALLCGFLPVMFCAAPLLLYDALCEKRCPALLPAAGVCLRLPSFHALQLLITAAGAVTAWMIYQRVSALEQTVGHLTGLRDEITEKNMQLAAQNRLLAEAQDNEIHLATLRERNRIAREIHDNVGHMLTRSILQTGALRVLNRDESLAAPLSELKETLDGAMTSIRTSVHDLHDDAIDLERTIREMAGGVDDRFDVTVHYDAGGRIPGEVKLCTAGVVREGISNAVRHSGGDKISIIFREHPAFYQLQIEDNGCVTEIGHGGIGLKNMEDRAADCGGRITFTPSERGFRIFMTIPKEQEHEDRGH